MFEIRAGEYELFNNSFYVDDTKILIRTRKKNITPSKPPNYLEGYRINEKNKKDRSYISSLYQVSSNVYKFDFNRQCYNFVLDGSIDSSSKVIIEKV